MWALEKEAVLQYNSTTWKLAYLPYLTVQATYLLLGGMRYRNSCWLIGEPISKGTSLRVAGASDFW